MSRNLGLRALAAITALTVATLAASGAGAAATTKPPTIHNFLPKLGSAGVVLTITGSNFTGATAVKVAGYKATFTVVSASKITATVPSTAKTGTISVTTKSGTARSTTDFTLVAPNGSGTMTASLSSVVAGATGQTITFTYTAAPAGTDDGAVTITAPSGWSAPVVTAAVGCTTASAGTVATTGQTITVRGLTLAGGGTVTITYGATSGGSCTSGDGATAATTSGAATWQAQERSIYSGKLTVLASSPSITT